MSFLNPVHLVLGVVQGMITGIRGLCNGLGPALYGFIFFLFNVELNDLGPVVDPPKQNMEVRSIWSPKALDLLNPHDGSGPSEPA